MSMPTPVTHAAVPELPPVLTAPEGLSMPAARGWVEESRTAIRAGIRQRGAIRLRRLPIATPEDVAVLRDVLVDAPAAYREKATPRTEYGNSVYSSTDLPPSQAIRPHNENSYTLTFPGIVIFGCLAAPQRGGATTLCDVRSVLRALPVDLAERFRAKGWLLTRNFSELVGLPWRISFGTPHRDVVERYCTENLVGCEWLEGGQLRTRQRRPAIIHHPWTDEEVWFNHVGFWNEWSLDPEVRETMVDEFGAGGLPFNTSYGDGRPLDRDEIDTINCAYDSATTHELWEPGDLLVVDNILMAHGRDSYLGERRIVVTMGEPIDLSQCRPTTAPTPGPV